jgi:TIR domain
VRLDGAFGLPGQMDAVQDEADVHVLCLSTNYHRSVACRHEMQRAVALDSQFARGIVIPVRLDDAPLSVAIAVADPLWVDMRNDSSSPDPELLEEKNLM